MKRIDIDHKGNIDITTPDVAGKFMNLFSGKGTTHTFHLEQTKEDKEYQAYQESIGAAPTFNGKGMGLDIKEDGKFISDLRDGNKYAAMLASVILEQFLFTNQPNHEN